MQWLLLLFLVGFPEKDNSIVEHDFGKLIALVCLVH